MRLSRGGYLHSIYNDLVNSKGLVHQCVNNKYPSEVSKIQIESINYLSSQPFEINRDQLDFLMED